MIKNYFKTALRNLFKNKLFSLINIFGLSVGAACTLVILLWVKSEFDVDAFHQNGRNLYTIYERHLYDHKVVGQYFTPCLMARELKKVFPEIEYATSLSYNQPVTFRSGNKLLKEQGTYADEDFFKMFSYKILQGNAQHALSDVADIAISKKMAIAFFGSPEGALGKTVFDYDDTLNLTVSTVYEDIQENSSKQFDFLINWNAFIRVNPWAKDWNSEGPSTYIQLRPDANESVVANKLLHFLDNYNKKVDPGSIELALQRYDEGYLHNNLADGKIEGGRISYVRLFSIIGLAILLIACINFMNLTTANSLKRAKEIGIRKASGARRPMLILQFIGESVLFTTVAVAIAVLIAAMLLPLFNTVTQKQITIPIGSLSFWLELAALAVVVGIISGSYPALFLSRLDAIKTLKGAVKFGIRSILLRKGLVIFQFVLSGILIIGTIVISRQISYIQSVNLGFERENLIYVPLDQVLVGKYKFFKQELSGMPGIQSVSRIANVPSNLGLTTTNVTWEGKTLNNKPIFTFTSAGYDFVQTMKLKLIAGRDHSADFKTDSVGYILNETALKLTGYQDPIGKPFSLYQRRGYIIGIVKDFHFRSVHESIKPLVIRQYQDNDVFGNPMVIVRTTSGQTRQALAAIENLYTSLNPNSPFTYTFSDDQYQKLYNNEQITGKLAYGFTFLAILISCLGLLGLAMFTAEQRLKEISIRKVLGASVGSLLRLLSMEFAVLIVIAMLIATPIAWYAMENWLANYAYHTVIGLEVFALAWGISLLITFTIVAFQSAKISRVNPIKILRSE